MKRAISKHARNLYFDAKKLWRQGRQHEAYQALQAAIQLYPHDANLHFHAGDFARRLGLLDDGVRLLERALRLDPSDTHTRVCLGACHMQARDFEAAISVLEKAREQDAQNTSVLGALGQAYTASDRPEEALPVLKELTRLEPNDVVALTRLGQAYQMVGARKPARAAFEKAHALDPHDPLVATPLARLLCAEHDYRRSAAIIENAAQASGLDERMTAVLAKAYIGAGRFAEADAILDGAAGQRLEGSVRATLQLSLAIREAQRDASKVNRADALCARFDMRSEADPAIRYLVAKNHFVRGRAGLAARTLGPLVAEKNYPATVLFLASADETHPLLIPVEQEWRERLPSMREQAQTLHQNPDMFDDEITPGPRSSPVFEGLYPTPADALARRVTQRARPNSAA